jgi:hypothetical protein
VDYEEKNWMRLGYSKHCIEVGDTLHDAIKAKESLTHTSLSSFILWNHAYYLHGQHDPSN